MTAQISKWGNSLGVRIPGVLAKDLGLHEGSEVDVEEVDGAIVLRPMRSKLRRKYSLDELIAGITPENLHEETGWGEPCGKEVW